MTTVLACPVCGAVLALEPTSATCPERHSFDRARGGYLNLLLSNKKQSAEPGDSPAMLRSRRAFLQAGFYGGMSDAAIAAVIGSITDRPAAHVADLGCGEGYFTARAQQAMAAVSAETTMYGVDISRPGIKMASSYGRDVHWIVASLHRSPFLPQSLDTVLSVFAPIDAADVRRVIRDDGALITVTPGPDHLDALRIIIYTSVKPHPKTPAIMTDDTLFEAPTSTRVRYSIALESQVEIMHLLSMTPYYWHISHATRKAVEDLTRLDITVDAYVNVFRPKAR